MGQRVLMSGRKVVSCLASAGMVVRRRASSEVRSEGEAEVR